MLMRVWMFTLAIGLWVVVIRPVIPMSLSFSFRDADIDEETRRGVARTVTTLRGRSVSQSVRPNRTVPATTGGSCAVDKLFLQASSRNGNSRAPPTVSNHLICRQCQGCLLALIIPHHSIGNTEHRLSLVVVVVNVTVSGSGGMTK
ncbi:hypothetical protein B0J15DRAFT_458728 [Fusarium solani]|uniref:Uncharacterized protein n=1 Tax=Fusarium solani TaxID=169388 RepID=A0A9P9RCM6_FUSSL|nr:uncharacterized protein B0J15DRAFT_458728 [Fusarium solani]KAH7273623.1 hypothetical protein B0J15DRAFT_458728 [Fusarium solani]